MDRYLTSSATGSNRYVQTPSSVNDETIAKVLRHLLKTPYRCAEEIAQLESLSPVEMDSIYRYIQTSEVCQKEFMSSHNRDYFDTVRNHFGKRQYTVVFFVGLYCPARCHFCPSVEVQEDGKRDLFRYQSSTAEQQKLTYADCRRIFDDLAHLQQTGTRISIKISGGLEPFTDPKTIGWILSLAREHGMHSTIFTNGMLLKLAKNRELALQCDTIRISLSTSDHESYREAYFGRHRDNKEIITLPELFLTLQQLIRQRDGSGATTEIGVNTVAGHFNFHELEQLIRDTTTLGVDYIEVKGEYFETKSAAWFDALEPVLADIQQQMVNDRIARTRIGLTGSLGRHNFFNQAPTGLCRPQDQANHKMFINPFGECTPVHYWAYPNGGRQQQTRRFIGGLTPQTNLLELITRGDELPELDYVHLNPFELILSLESSRQRRDLLFGINPANNPYLQDRPHNLANHRQSWNNAAVIL